MKKLFIGIVTLISASLLVACSSGKAPGSTASSNIEVKFEGVYEHMQTTEKELWYDVYSNDNMVDKDDEVKSILVVNYGQVQAYALPDDMTIGSLSKMTDEEILKNLSDWNKDKITETIEYWKKQLATAKSSYEAHVNSEAEEYDDGEGYLEELSSEIKTAEESIELITSQQGNKVPEFKLEAKIETDSTGNEAMLETIYYFSPFYWENISLEEVESGRLAGEKSREWKVSFQFNSFPTFVIYDSNYRGMNYRYNDGDSSGDYLLTRSQVNFKFDSVDTEGIVVD